MGLLKTGSRADAEPLDCNYNLLESIVKIESVPFKGGYYMCIEGSERAETLRNANRAWTMGYDTLARDLLAAAMMQPGCAFEHREQQAQPETVGGFIKSTDQRFYDLLRANGDIGAEND